MFCCVIFFLLASVRLLAGRVRGCMTKGLRRPAVDALMWFILSTMFVSTPKVVITKRFHQTSAHHIVSKELLREKCTYRKFKTDNGVK